jgi:hypothetical protein
MDKPSKRIIFTKGDHAKVEFVAAPEGTADSIGTIKGYALVWNVLSSDRGGYKVRLLPGSAKFTSTVHALYHHEWTGGPLGDTQTNTLRILPADDYGIPVEIDLPDTTNGRDTLELVRTGRMTGMSFAMIGKPTSHETEEDGETVLNAEAYEVDEVTVTALPAFTQTVVAVKPDPEPEQLSADKKNPESGKESARQSRKLSELRLSVLKL